MSLKKKPKRVRNQYAAILSASVTMIIFGLWITTWRQFELPPQATPATGIHPFAAIGSVFTGGFDSFRDQFSGTNTKWSKFAASISNPTAPTSSIEKSLTDSVILGATSTDVTQ